MGIRRSHKRHGAEAKHLSERPALAEAPQNTSPAPVPQDISLTDLPEELVAARAYEKWQLRGCPMGQDQSHDWFAARTELQAERLNWTAPQPDDAERGAGK